MSTNALLSFIDTHQRAFIQLSPKVFSGKPFVLGLGDRLAPSKVSVTVKHVGLWTWVQILFRVLQLLSKTFGMKYLDLFLELDFYLKRQVVEYWNVLTTVTQIITHAFNPCILNLYLKRLPHIRLFIGNYFQIFSNTSNRSS